MPQLAAFIPRALMVVEAFFGQQEDVTWHLVTDLPGALRVAWAREQHELALAVHRLRLEHSNSIPDIAQVLGVRRENLWEKLSGRRPAQEEDLILWSWMIGKPRPIYRPEDLVAHPIRIPSFPMYRRPTR